MNNKEITVQETQKSETQVPKEKTFANTRRKSFTRSYALLPSFTDMEDVIMEEEISQTS